MRQRARGPYYPGPQGLQALQRPLGLYWPPGLVNGSRDPLTGYRTQCRLEAAQYTRTGSWGTGRPLAGPLYEIKQLCFNPGEGAEERKRAEKSS